MECINKKCTKPQVNIVNAYLMPFHGAYREVTQYVCFGCKQAFAIAGPYTTKKAWKEKVLNKIESIRKRINNSQKKDCPDCKDLPEGEVVKGHEHRITTEQPITQPNETRI